MAFVSRRLAPQAHAETFASHGSDHLPVVFSVQKQGNEPRRKAHYPFKYVKSDLDMMSKLRKPTHNKTATESRHQTTLVE